MRTYLALAILAITACKGSSAEPKAQKPSNLAQVREGSASVPLEEDEDPKAGPRSIADTREQKMKTDFTKPDYADPNFKPKGTPTPGTPTVSKDKKKGDQQDDDWIPAEFKQGNARWKDCGVYVDGKPIGFLSWGELPIGMPVVWKKDFVSVNKRPGTNDPDSRETRQRVYRFTDYLKLMGVDPKQVKELHVYGPKLTSTLIVPNADLNGPKGNEFYFRFGTNTAGKPIPSVPGTIGNGNVPDKIASVMVYIKKKPPTLDRDEGMVLDGNRELGVPYHGDPIRGGVRVYLDNKLAGIIKRQELDGKTAIADKDGNMQWKLVETLAKQGVDLKKAVEMWVIRGEKREEKFEAKDFASMTFNASSQAHGGVAIHTPDRDAQANVLAFHSRPIKPDEIPQVLPDDE